MNDISVVMITMDREAEGKENYLPATLDSFGHGKIFSSDRLHSFHICVSRIASWSWLDGWTGQFFDRNPGLLNVYSRDRLACENAGFALQTGARSGASWVLFCEDDILVCNDFLGSVGRWLDEYADDSRYTLYSFGTPYDQVKKADPFTGNSWRYPVSSFYGTQCFAMRPEHALSLGAYIASNPIVRGVTNPNAYDLMFQDWMRENHPTKTFLASVPSFVQHIGAQSICTGKEKTHTFDSFPGVGWSYYPDEKEVSVGTLPKALKNKTENETSTIKRGFLILGPESSGTRLVTRILINNGCHGSDEHIQPFDSEPFNGLSPVVLRRSIPHYREWLNVESDGILRKFDGYDLIVIVTTRDHHAMISSQVEVGHAETYHKAQENIAAAYDQIFSFIKEHDLKYVISSYESLIYEPVEAQKRLVDSLGLTFTEAVTITNENTKHYLVNGKSGANLDRKPHILFVGDAVISTGFSRSTHAVCDYLSSHGYDVTVLGMNYHGDPHPYSYTIYPAVSPIDSCTDYGGAARLPLIMDKVKPDLIVIQQDPWNIPAYLDYIRYAYEVAAEKCISFHIPPIIGYLAVDAENHKGYQLEDLSHIVTWTEFGRGELIQGGYTGPTSVVPLGVDTIFYPRDKKESRSRVCSDPRIASDAYIVGYVGRNQYRKRLDLTIEYFAEWVRRGGVDNAYLYLYTGSSGEKSVDIESLVSYYGIRGRVIINTPPTGYGNPEIILPYVYSSFDVYLSTSMAEGFCLPVLEAMACGVPVICPDIGGFDWTGSIPMKVPCTSSAMVAPLNDQQYTVGGIPDKEETVTALSNCYRYLKGQQRERMIQKGLDLAGRLTWKRTGEQFERVVEKVLDSSRRSLV